TGFPDIRVRGHVGFSQGNRVAICLFRRRTIAEQTLDVTDHAQRASLVLSAGGINRFVLDHLLVETEQILQELFSDLRDLGNLKQSRIVEAFGYAIDDRARTEEVPIGPT